MTIDIHIPVVKYADGVSTRTASETRAKILDIARELFAIQGYAGTSIADIATRLGATKGALYYHFKSKDQILDALVAEPAAALSLIAERATKHPGPPATEVLAALIDLQADHPASYLAVYAGDPSLLKEYTRRHNFEEQTDQIVAALAGPQPEPARLIRARIAVTAVKEGTMAALVLGHGHLTADMRAEILAAALGALGGSG